MEKNFPRAPIVSLAEAFGSAHGRRLSVAGKTLKITVQHANNYITVFVSYFLCAILIQFNHMIKIYNSPVDYQSSNLVNSVNPIQNQTDSRVTIIPQNC